MAKNGKTKYRGEFGELKGLVKQLGYSGEWSGDDKKRVFRSNDGALLNWWPSTGTLDTQGTNAAALATAISRAVQDRCDAVEPPASDTVATRTERDEISQRVFVVHGHDRSACDQLKLILHELGLEPFVLADTGGQGLTIIEALEKEIRSSTNRRFGIVLLTPDDMGCEKGEHPGRAEPRARQNVVMEMGMLIAAFGRERVAILRKSDVVVPSDANGIIYLEFKEHVKEAVPKLCDRLQSAGFVLEPVAITRACS